MKQWHIRWQQWRFRHYRVEYLQYLTALLKQNPDQKTLKVIFTKEVERYGKAHTRGCLAQLWLQRLSTHGGDLAAAWQGCFSADVLHVIRISQQYGSRSLVQALAHLAHYLEQQKELKQKTLTILWPALFATSVVVLAVFLIPLLTVPELKRSFALVPPEYYGIYTRRLFWFAEWLKGYGWLLLLTPALSLFLVRYSFSRWVALGRTIADRYEPWSSYRLMQVHNLLALAHILLELPGLHLTLREVVHALFATSNRWLKSHLLQIEQRIRLGHVGPKSFETGLLHKEELWFFSDMAEGQNLSRACQLTAARLKEQLTQRLLKRAAVLRWIILLAGVALLVAVLFSHYRAFEELRQGLLNTFV